MVPLNTPVTLFTPTPGVEIWYTEDDTTTPAKNGTGSTKYTTPIPVTAAKTIKYNGNTDAINAGTNTVTFDVAVGTNYNAKSGLNGGSLTIDKRTLVADDFDVTGLPTAAVATVPAINVTVKSPLTAPTFVLKYRDVNGSDPADENPPTTDGTYEVSIEITASDNYNAVANLVLGSFEIQIQ